MHKLEGRLRVVIEEVLNLLGHRLDEEIVYQTLLEWEKDCQRYRGTPPRRLSKSITQIKQYIKYLQQGIYGYQKLKEIEPDIRNPFIKQPNDFNETRERIEKDIQDLTHTAELLQAIKSFEYDHNAIEFHSIGKIFDAGIKLGLASTAKVGAGRGNKNELIEFACIITDIVDKRKMRQHLKAHQKLEALIEIESE